MNRDNFHDIKKYRKINNFLVYNDNCLLFNKDLILRRFFAPADRKFFQSSDYKEILNNHYFNNNFNIN
ncbi:MAG: hypothetical protein ACP5JU_02040 [Minisyncoccia bacterium]